MTPKPPKPQKGHFPWNKETIHPAAGSKFAMTDFSTSPFESSHIASPSEQAATQSLHLINRVLDLVRSGGMSLPEGEAMIGTYLGDLEQFQQEEIQGVLQEIKKTKK